jgi:DNA-binding transcriptional regulator YdaS (Cro superfamily)
MPPKSKLNPDGDDKAVRRKLSAAYKKYGNQKKVADALGVSPATVSTWIARVGLREHTILVSRDRSGDTAKSA